MTSHDRRRSYRPGGWFGIFGDQASVLLPPSEKHRVAALWELVDEGAGFDEVLDALLASGLRDLPGFVLVSEAEHGTKVVLRGPAVAAFVADGEMVELAGSSETTWVERSLSGVTQMFVQVEPTVEDSNQDLVVENGLVRLARVDQPPFAPVTEADEPAEFGEAPAEEAAVDTADPIPVVVETPAGDETSADDETPVEDETLVEDGPLVVDGLETAASEPAYDEPEPPIWEPGAQSRPELESEAPQGTPAGAFGVAPPAYPPAPEPPASDHDGMTGGGWEPDGISRPQSGMASESSSEEVGPSVARLLFSGGEVIEVDRSVLIGRAPEVRRFAAEDRPRLVPVPSPHQEISSTHLEIRPGVGADHGSAVVTDLGSTNGTVLVQPGLPSEELRPGIAVQLVPGAIIDLGEGVTIQVAQP